MLEENKGWYVGEFSKAFDFRVLAQFGDGDLSPMCKNMQMTIAIQFRGETHYFAGVEPAIGVFLECPGKGKPEFITLTTQDTEALEAYQQLMANPFIEVPDGVNI